MVSIIACNGHGSNISTCPSPSVIRPVEEAHPGHELTSRMGIGGGLKDGSPP